MLLFRSFLFRQLYYWDIRYIASKSILGDIISKQSSEHITLTIFLLPFLWCFLSSIFKSLLNSHCSDSSRVYVCVIWYIYHVYMLYIYMQTHMCIQYIYIHIWSFHFTQQHVYLWCTHSGLIFFNQILIYTQYPIFKSHTKKSFNLSIFSNTICSTAF